MTIQDFEKLNNLSKLQDECRSAVLAGKHHLKMLLRAPNEDWRKKWIELIRDDFIRIDEAFKKYGGHKNEKDNDNPSGGIRMGDGIRTG